jgi:hypothetical protein
VALVFSVLIGIPIGLVGGFFVHGANFSLGDDPLWRHTVVDSVGGQ